MNKKWFECSVKYRKTLETGARKVVTELFLVDAVSFTEAEAIINEKIKELVSEEFRVTNLKTSNYSEIVRKEEGDFYFKSKISLIAYDEESGKERSTSIYLLVQANDAKEAYDTTVEAMKNTMGEYHIPSVSLTKIVEVFEYVSEENNN